MTIYNFFDKESLIEKYKLVEHKYIWWGIAAWLVNNFVKDNVFYNKCVSVELGMEVLKNFHMVETAFIIIKINMSAQMMIVNISIVI